MDEPALSRRDLLERSALAGVTLVAACGACAATGALAGCAVQKKTPIITTGILNIGTADHYPAGTVSTAFLATHGIVITNDSGTALALRPICTHKGCTVHWEPDFFQFDCPCHGSKFDLLGQVTHGPAKKPLAGLAAVAQPDGTLTVNLDQLYAMPV
jgi:nitrite reductase/ring-hydroxylating ferredoxin subunit